MPIDEKLLQQIKNNDKTQTLVYSSFNPIGAEEFKALSQVLEQNKTQTLVYSSFNPIGAEGFKALSQVLEQNKTLTSVDLRCNQIGDEGAKALSQALLQNQTLTSVHLENNLIGIGAEGAKALGQALLQNKTLTSLGLEYNQIGDEGAKALAQALEQNKTLTSLGLRRNQIGNEGAKALAQALEQNKTLTSVDLGDNSIGDEGAKALSQVFLQNKTLTLLNFSSKEAIGRDLKANINKSAEANKAKAEALRTAADTGNLAKVKQLITQGVSLNYQNYSDGNTALHLAAAKGHQAIVDLLCSQPHQVILRNYFTGEYPKGLSPADLKQPALQAPAAMATPPHLNPSILAQVPAKPSPAAEAPLSQSPDFKAQPIKNQSPAPKPLVQAPLINRDDFTVGEHLGSGSYGVVNKGTWLTVPVAIKRLSAFTQDEGTSKEFMQETGLMATLVHPNIIRLYGICMEENEQAMLLEYMPKGSLENFLKKNKQTLSWETRFQMALSIGKGLIYLHHKNILHRDLKSANVLLDEQLQAKLCDFGFAKVKTASKSSLKSKSSKEQQSQQAAEIGTLRYLAPECLAGQYSQASDVYSYGMLLWELATDKIPYNEFDSFAVMKLIQAGKRPQIPQNIPPVFIEWITKCWAKQPQDRPTMEAIVKALSERQAEAKPYSPPKSPATPLVKLAASYQIASPQIQFNPQDKLGEGSFGCVYKGKWQYTEVAIKQLKVTQMTAKALQEFEQEIQVMAQIAHPNVVKLYGACLEPNHYCMVMEYLPKGSLYSQLHSLESLTWPVRWKIALDIGKGILHLHSKNILHRDLKSLNVLLDKDYRAKISDFGLSLVKSESQTVSSKAPQSAQAQAPQLAAGTPAWTAPELFDVKSKPTKAADIYSYGMILWELASGKIPYEGMNPMMLMFAVVVQAQRLDIPKETPPSYAKLITKCWAQRAEDRPKIEDVVAELEAKQGEASMQFAA